MLPSASHQVVLLGRMGHVFLVVVNNWSIASFEMELIYLLRCMAISQLCCIAVCQCDSSAVTLVASALATNCLSRPCAVTSQLCPVAIIIMYTTCTAAGTAVSLPGKDFMSRYRTLSLGAAQWPNPPSSVRGNGLLDFKLPVSCMQCPYIQ